MEKTSKKWFLKNIFRKNNKKENPSADSSDEEDAKAGFYSADFYLKKFSPKKKSESSSHHNNVNNNSYHHRVYNPKANSEFCYFEAPQKQLQQPQQRSEVIYQASQPNDNEYHNFIAARNNINNSDTRHYSLSPRCFSNTELSIDYGSQASSQDEKISCNSYNQQQHLVDVKNEINSQTSFADAAAILAANKKTRAARNQRYYQRLLRDEGRPSTIYGCVYDDFSGNIINSNDGSIKSTKSSQQLPNSVSNQNVSTRLPGPRYRGATLSDLDDYENILKVDEAVPPPIPPRDPNRRFSMHNSITKNPYYFDHQLQKYVVINKSRPKPETSDKPHYAVERKSDAHSSSNINANNQRSNSTNDLAVTKMYHDQPSSQQQPKSYQRYNKQQRNLTITEGVKFPFSSGIAGDSTVTGLPFYSQDHVHQMPHKKFSSFEDINRFRGVNSSLEASQPPQHVNQNSSNAKTVTTTTTSGRKITEKKTNLDDAINELEKMYSRLISDECLLNMSDHRKLPTLDDYSAMIKKYDEYEQEENRTDREPDLVKDDVFSRNIQHANKMLKNIDQLPFGIPNRAIQPIPPKPPRDYLSVKPDKATPVVVSQSKPDLIADDLAVRNLRRDNFANSRQIQSLCESMNGGTGTGSLSNIAQILSPVTQKLHIGILNGARRPSGGKRREDGVGGRDGEDADAADSDAENRELEESLNALIIESKAISEKLGEDLSKMKATKSINRISSVDLLDFEKKLNKNNKNEVETSPVSKSNDQMREVKQLRSPAHKSPTLTTPQKSMVKNAVVHDVERVKMDVQMVSTACSPIRELQTKSTAAASAPPVDIPKTPTKSAFVRANSVERSMPQASPKISELIQMFSNKESSTTPVKPKPAAFKLTPRSKSIDSNAFVVKSKSPEKTTSQNEFESNIENIRDLIKQMKKTEFDLATPSKPLQKHENDSREPSTDFDQKSSGTESINTTTSSLKTMESNESLPKIAIRPDELLTSAIERDAIAIDDEEEEEDVDEVEDEVENENVDDNNNREDEDVVGEKIVLRDESCCSQRKVVNDVEENINEDERPPETTTTPADDEDTKMTLEEKVKKQLENISLNLEKFKDENSTITMTTPQSLASKICSDANNNSSISGQVLDVESLYNSTEELSMIFANAENYVSQGNEDDELDVLDADFVAASEKEFEKLVLDCNNNNSDIFDNQLLTNGDFALGMCPLSSVEAQKRTNSPAMSIINSNHQHRHVTDDDKSNNACSTQSTTIPKTQDNSFNSSTKALMKDESADRATKKSNNDDGGSKQQQKKSKSSSSSNSTSTFNPLSTLQQQAFALACVYFIILLTQMLTFN